MSALTMCFILFFFFNDTATTEIYTLSLHDALPISGAERVGDAIRGRTMPPCWLARRRDRKSTRLNSSHLGISYAVFCLKKKKKIHKINIKIQNELPYKQDHQGTPSTHQMTADQRFY